MKIKTRISRFLKNWPLYHGHGTKFIYYPPKLESYSQLRKRRKYEFWVKKNGQPFIFFESSLEPIILNDNWLSNLRIQE